MERKHRMEHLEEESRFQIRNQTFSKEIDLDPYIKFNALGRIIFLDCRFEELDLLGKVFGSCGFQNCQFQKLNFRKCQFSNCRFQNCQIINSNLTRAEFHDCSFRNCEFLQSDLTASEFWNCELRETTFQKSHLDLIGVQDLKCWKSNELTEIPESSNFANILKDMNWISSDEG